MWPFPLLHSCTLHYFFPPPDDTLFVNIGAGETTWTQLATSEAPSPRYGFVSGVFENYWIVSHGT